MIKCVRHWACNVHALLSALGFGITLSTATASDLVIPCGLANSEGTGASGILTESAREQTVYAASNFPAEPITINGLRFRPNASGYNPGGPFSHTKRFIHVILSTTSRSPGGLSRTFRENTGPDAELVVHGNVTLSSRFTGPDGGPKDFDIVVPFSSPFTYNPSAGNLLVDIEDFSGDSTAPVDAQNSTAGSATRVVSNSPSSPTGSMDADADVMEIVFHPATDTNSPPPATGCVAPPPGMISWWRAEGDALDSVGSNNGVLMNGVTFGPGMVGQAFYFNGVDSYVSIPNSPSLNLRGEITLEFWYKNLGGSYYSYGLVAKRGEGVPPCNYGINIVPTGLGLYYFDPTVANNGDDGGSYEASRYLPIPADNEFHHLGATFKQVGSETIQLRTYIDGVLVRTLNLNGNLARTLNTAQVTIGTSSIQGEYFNGIIDELSIYNRVLTASEIKGIYAAGSAGKCLPASRPLPRVALQIAAEPATHTLSAGQTQAPGLGLKWPADSSDYILLESSNLLNWYPANPSLLTNGGMISAEMPAPGHGVFYRLKHK